MGNLHAENYGPCGAQVEKELKIESDKNKSTVWALVLSLLAFIITGFQQNRQINQLMVTTDEMAGFHVYCRDYSNALPATIFVWFVPSRKIFLPLSQEDPSIRKTRLALMTSSTLKLSAF